MSSSIPLPLDLPQHLAQANWLSIEIVRYVDEVGDSNLFATDTLKKDAAVLSEQNCRPEDPTGNDRQLLLNLLREFCKPLPTKGGAQ